MRMIIKMEDKKSKGAREDTWSMFGNCFFP